MTLTAEQQAVLDRFPLADEPVEGVNAEQALQLRIDGFFAWCDFEGVDRPDEESARAAVSGG